MNVQLIEFILVHPPKKITLGPVRVGSLHQLRAIDTRKLKTRKARLEIVLTEPSNIRKNIPQTKLNIWVIWIKQDTNYNGDVSTLFHGHCWTYFFCWTVKVPSCLNQYRTISFALPEHWSYFCNFSAFLSLGWASWDVLTQLFVWPCVVTLSYQTFYVKISIFKKSKVSHQ